MKKKNIIPLLLTCLIMSACGESKAPAQTPPPAETTTTTAAATAETTTTAAEKTVSAVETTAETTAAPETTTEKITVPPQEVGFEGMESVGGSAVKDGEYHINVDSSSSMFKIADCVLKVKDGEMTADIIIASKSYEYLFMGTGEEADAVSSEIPYIGYTTDEQDRSVFTVPVEALDKEIQCAAFSAKKKTWYDRTLVFRADSLPDDAFAESRYADAASLELADGEYTCEVTLEGGSGRASVQSPAKIAVKDGKVAAEIIWSSNKYDYMIVEGEKLLPVSCEEHSVFEIPVKGFDFKMPVSADTTAMSTPYEIEYTLYFDSATIK
ncbi:MAG: hypothetical protein K6B74_12865 [Ruminococcus sp.]|nr:hypothetical protein [Ruminococcus sp.]